MKRMALALAWAFVGSTAAFQALMPPFHARAAQERPAVIAQAAAPPLQAPNPAARTIDDMFRYFTGQEQDRLERQLTPRTQAWKRARIELARRGLAELQTFDRASISESERLSCDVMQWQLQAIVDEE